MQIPLSTVDGTWDEQKDSAVKTSGLGHVMTVENSEKRPQNSAQLSGVGKADPISIPYPPCAHMAQRRIVEPKEILRG